MNVNFVNVFDKTIKEVILQIDDRMIRAIEVTGFENPELPYIMPGFVDAHVHIESSMLTPSQFARLAVVHGTVATVSDPHEIANVLGYKGVEYMIEDSRRVPFKFCFGAPSCVPATTFETAGAIIDPEGVKKLLELPEIGYLAEVMNFPGVLNGDPDMVAKLNWARHFGKPIDGHAPGLRGADARRYADEGISTDHECFTYDEAFEKIGYGVKILIREGSAARNFHALIPLLDGYPDMIMFCSDDKHPDNLVEGHINILVKRALSAGNSLWKVLQAACINPVLHYNLPVGLLRPDDPADFILVDNLQNFNILETWIDGQVVARQAQSLLPDLRSVHINKFDCLPKKSEEFQCKIQNNSSHLRIIEALDGQLFTNELLSPALTSEGLVVSDIENDILKITVVNRYENKQPPVAFVKNFGLKTGAIASSVAHDSHNIIAVGVDDVSICEAVNLIIGAKGGVSAVGSGESHLLELPIAGLMSDQDGYKTADTYTRLDRFVKDKLGSRLQSPFMTLSFMALLVIPSIKISDMGLFDGTNFRLIDLESGAEAK